MKICIFGAASYEIDKTYSADTRKLCKTLAEKGHSLVFGAGGNGLMGAAAEGFKTGGGEDCRRHSSLFWSMKILKKFILNVQKLFLQIL